MYTQRQILGKIFQTVFNSEFNVDSRDDRIILQKVVYLMRMGGVNCGHYSFYWDEFGPYCPELSDDMKQPCEPYGCEFDFTKDAEEILEKLRYSLNNQKEYTRRYWVEAIASLKYLQTSIYPLYSKEQLLDSLTNRKQYLVNTNENERAMQELKTIFA